MNRNAEYEQLMQSLDSLPIPEGGVNRALRRRRRNRFLLRPLAGIAAAFALFIFLVNVSATVAYACSCVPGLRELASAVTFSRSLSDAVENEYVQAMDLVESNGEIKVRVEYLIVDQKNVTVFFRCLSEKYPLLEVEPEVFAVEGEASPPCAVGLGGAVPTGELRSLSISYFEEDVPSSLHLHLKLLNSEFGGTKSEPAPGKTREDEPQTEPRYIAAFDFLLQFDPYFTAQGKHFEAKKRIVLEDQTLYITGIDVYPSYLSFSIQGDAANTAWLKSLSFYLVTDRGERFNPVSNGITATGTADTPEMITYRADSAFFYEAGEITLYVTGAEWLDKAKETVRIDLKNAEADDMPEGAALVSAEREDGRWIITVLREDRVSQVFMPDYYDAEGTHYLLRSWTTGASMLDGREAPEGYTYERYPLDDYPYDEVWFVPRYTHSWSADTPVAAVIPLN